MSRFRSRVKGAAALAAAALVAAILQAPAAVADTMPVDPTNPKTPVTVSAQPLPTVQIDGVAWTQLVIGNTVYVGGNFTTARPAGAAPGTNTTPRANLLAYDIRTGELLSTWAPTTNAEVRTLTASPDKTRIYVGGSFTKLNEGKPGGGNYSRIAAVSATTGAVIPSFHPRPDATVRAIVATDDTVYYGGQLSQVDGVTRSRAAAARASDGALLSWAPYLTGGSVYSMVMSPDRSKIVIGGSFTAANGSSNPGYGLVMVTPEVGSSLPLPANSTIRNGGVNAAILSLTSDADSFYATGYVFGAGGVLEGMTRINWSDGNVVWVEDCHGDSYGNYPKGDVIYVASHAHYCGNLPDGFPQTEPWTQHYGTAFTKATTGTLKADPLGYANWVGTPSPELLKWFPLLLNGTFTGQGQAGWTISGNDDYVVIGGEFPRAGGQPQQGLVRYSTREIGPNTLGPEFSGSKFLPSVNSIATGMVRVNWQANWDRDNENLTYQVIRDGVKVYETTSLSSEWNRPGLGFLDKNLVPGNTYRYRVFAIDPHGNIARGDYVSVVASDQGELSAYAADVLDDSPTNYWRLGEPSGSAVYDWAGSGDAVVRNGVNRGAAGAIIGDSDAASSFNGSSGLASESAAHPGPSTFSVEAWIKTTTTRGGKIVGLGNAAVGSSDRYDRQLYMSNNGRINFGVSAGPNIAITSGASFNDGNWHHVVGSVGSAGMQLMVDGVRVASRADVTAAVDTYPGYWRIGGDRLSGWANQPTSSYFNGTIDDVAVYGAPLTLAQIQAHFTNSGRSLSNAGPADTYGKAVYQSDPEFYWRLSETNGSTANDSSPLNQQGLYSGGTTRNQPSAVGVGSDRSVTLNGSSGQVASKSTFTSPTTYSEELWFKTSTTNGGKLIGFGDKQTTLSTNYDRHVYMLNNGRLRFGVWANAQVTIDTQASYNDNKWHHLTATQGPDGMKLYVDGVVAASGPQTAAQPFTGYWRVGSDAHWGGASSNYFAGSIDEVAVYSRVLPAAEIQDHFVKGGGTLPNQLPKPEFTFEATDLTVDFDGSSSTDADGTIVSYWWDFGDGNTASVAKPTHAYAAAGSYRVQLVVTDDDSAVVSKEQTVTVTAPPANIDPVAAFTYEASDLLVEFDGSTSSDSDGTVASYAWDFGDGETADVAKPSHTFDESGDFEVKLTVTDDDGATNSVTKTVSVVAGPPGPLAGDTFERTTTNGWGTADDGGAWTPLASAGYFSVANGAGHIKVPLAARGGTITLKSVDAADIDVQMKVSLDKVADGGGTFVSLGGRASTAGDYRAKAKIQANGRVVLYLVKVVGTTETTLTTLNLPSSLTYTAGSALQLRLKVAGTNSTSLSAKVWQGTEPAAWQLTTTDSTAELQNTGGIAIVTYVSGTTTNAPIGFSFDDLVTNE